MTRSSMWCSLVFAVVLAAAGCGDEGGTAGTGGAAGSAGNAGSGGSSSGDCVRICESPCVGEILPDGRLAETGVQLVPKGYWTKATGVSCLPTRNRRSR